jgi:hypothetical protein
MKGDFYSMISSNFAFQINRCIDGKNPGVVCKKPEEINEYIKDIEINIWRLEQNIDFDVYDNPPTFLMTDPLLSDTLTSEK